MRPEDAMADWRRWSRRLKRKPVNRGPLDGGRSNQSYLLESDLGRLALRINGSTSMLPDRRRDFEITAWQQAGNAGIAPPLIYVDKDNSYIVSQYIDSMVPPGPAPGEEWSRLAIDLLKRCHALDCDGPVMDYGAHIKAYWQQIEQKNLQVSPTLHDQRSLVTAALDELSSIHDGTALCHHDPIPANFVGDSSRLYLLDWEYSAPGWPVMDFAALAVEWSIDHETIRRQTGISAKALKKAGIVYRYLRDLWNELTAPE